MLNSQNSTHLIAVFFANEFLISIMPSSQVSKNSSEIDLEKYRYNIDNYCNSCCALLGQKNPAYETILEKLVNCFRKSISCTRDMLIEFTCKELCSASMLKSFENTEKVNLFRKFLTDCVKSFTAYILVISKEYVDKIAKKDKEMLILYRKGIVQAFENNIVEIKNQFFAQFSCIEKGKNPEEVSVIRAENKLLEELRKQNEELRYENLQLRDKIARLLEQERVLKFEKSEKIEKTEPELDEEFSSENVSSE